VDENSPARFRKPIALGHAKQEMGELDEFMHILILNSDLGLGLNRGNEKKNRTV
jgi:hypothetical protein